MPNNSSSGGGESIYQSPDRLRLNHRSEDNAAPDAIELSDPDLEPSSLFTEDLGMEVGTASASSRGGLVQEFFLNDSLFSEGVPLLTSRTFP